MLTGQDYDRRVCIAILALLVGLPLCLLRKISSLSFTGLLSVLFVAFCAVALLLRACQLGAMAQPHAPTGVHANVIDFFNGVCVLAFAVCGQTTVFPVGH